MVASHDRSAAPCLALSCWNRALLLTCLYNGSPGDRVSPLKIQSSHSNSRRTGEAPTFLLLPAGLLLLLPPLFANSAQGKENVKLRSTKSQDLQRNQVCAGSMGIKFRETYWYFPVPHHKEARTITCSKHWSTIMHAGGKGNCSSHFDVPQGAT